MRTVLSLVLALVPALVFAQAQPRPGAFTTVATTNTSANSLNVGCAIGSNTCTGGIDAGSIALSSTGATALDMAGGISATVLALSNTGATAIDVAGGITAGTGNVAVIGTDGRIPAISSTYFANLSGTNLTGVARTASNETISGTYTFTADVRVSANVPSIRITETDQATDAKQWQFASSGGVFALFTVNDAESGGAEVLTVTRSTTTPLLTTLKTALALPNVISPSALTNGNNNDYNPTDLVTAYVLRVTSGGGSTALTGLAAQTAGRAIKICSVGFVDILAESASSSAANRFASAKTLVNGCVDGWYDGTSSRWRITQ